MNGLGHALDLGQLLGVEALRWDDHCRVLLIDVPAEADQMLPELHLQLPEAGNFLGSVSGGCVEQELAEAKRLREEAQKRQMETQARLQRLDEEMVEIRAEMVKAGEAERDRIVAQAEEKAMQLLQQIGLEQRAAHKPGELSGGERQRIALARALVKHADLVLLDRNLNETPDDALKDITVEKTMIDGKFVYEKIGTR